MNTISQEKVESLKSLFLNGGSIREAMRVTGVGKHTAHRYQRMVAGNKPPAMPIRAGEGVAFTTDMCKHSPQTERVALWEKACGAIPQGKRLGSKCRRAYCGFLEHMCLVEDKTARWYNWRKVVDIKKLAKIEVGSYLEFDMPSTDHAKNCLRVNISQQANVPFAIRLQPGKSKARLYRIDESWEGGRRSSAAHHFAIRLPAPIGGVELPPEERERRRLVLEQSRMERKAKLFLKNMRRGKQSIWLGQFRQTPEDAAFLALPRRSNCEVAGCAMPKNGDKLCRYHEHFFDYKESMDWRGVSYTDTHATEDQPIPTFTSLQGWELDRSAERVRFIHHGTAARNEDMGEKWLRENDPTYKPEQPITNIQHTGAFILWKGFGKRKIRKSQRKRPAGWHGNHPEQKPMYKEIDRESIAEWAPSGQSRPELIHANYDELPTEYERYEIADDDYERDMAIAQIDDDFGFEDLQ